MSIVNNTTQTVKFSQGKIYLEMHVTESTLFDDGVNEPMAETEDVTKLYAYFEQNVNDIVCYVKGFMKDSNGMTTVNLPTWTEANLATLGFTNLEELTPFYDDYMDYTYFDKTDFGFEITGDKAATWLLKSFEDAGVDQYIDVDSDVDVYAEYYVSNGVLSGERCEALIPCEFDYAPGMPLPATLELESTTTCTNYGTTVIARPEGLPN